MHMVKQAPLMQIPSIFVSVDLGSCLDQLAADLEMQQQIKKKWLGRLFLFIFVQSQTMAPKTPSTFDIFYSNS